MNYWSLAAVEPVAPSSVEWFWAMAVVVVVSLVSLRLAAAEVEPCAVNHSVYLYYLRYS